MTTTRTHADGRPCTMPTRAEFLASIATEAGPVRYLDQKGLAERAGMSHAYARLLRQKPEGPTGLPAPDCLFGERPGWLPSTIDRWLETRTSRATSTATPTTSTPRGAS